MRDFNGQREAAKKTFEAFIIERLPSDAITKDDFGNYKALSIHQHYLVWDHQQRKIDELLTAAIKVHDRVIEASRTGCHINWKACNGELEKLAEAIAKAGVPT